MAITTKTATKTAAKKIAELKQSPKPNNNGQHKISSKIVTVTPAKAEEWLEHNTHNRKINGHDVDQWAREMTEGRWYLDGDAIRFDTEGALLNGQHRLSAVIKSGTTQQFLVLYNLPTERQINMDTGRRRTAAAALQLIGEYGGYSSALAATARMAVRVQRKGLNTERLSGIPVSNQEIVDFVEDHPELFGIVKFTNVTYRQADIPSSAVAAYSYWRFSLIDADAALDFWTAAVEKTDLRAGSPVLAMTKRFAEARRSREFLSHQDQLSMIFRAWNAYHTGATIKKIQVRRGAEIIPVPEPI